MNPKIPSLHRRIRLLVWFFMAALIVSGLTAIPLVQELSLVLDLIAGPPALTAFLEQVRNTLVQVHQQYPFLQYGFDWLAFAHLVIAVAFIGVIRNPVRNKWVLDFGLIACLMVIPFACFFGPLRGLPWWWCLIDCSFGVVGLLPLGLARHYVLKLEKLQQEDRLNTIF